MIAAIAGLATTAHAESGASVPAFPGAEGFGASATGGRGKDVYEVTNLNDAGPGSFRDAVSKGDRTVVFRVGGTIELQSKIDLREPNLTIAGQTAPGGGICLRNYSVNVRASNMIIRHLRVRLGDADKQESDCLTIWHGVRDVIVDHCSVSWSVDEALSLAGDVGNVTVQWCMIYEALLQSLHAKGNHGYGSLSRATGPVTWHHNLWAHNDARNPRLGDNYGKEPKPLFDVRNNVIYDYGDVASGHTQGTFNANYVANYIKPGPSSKAKTPISVINNAKEPPSQLHFFLEGNVVEGKPELTADNRKFPNVTSIDGNQVFFFAEKPFDVAAVTTTSAEQAYQDVLASAGATLPMRDSADLRLIEHVKQGGGKMINSESEVGGWPALAAGEAVADSDHDGMPDAWETAHGFNPADVADRNADPDQDGYTNLEECLNDTDPKATS
jgi:pectate lyase